MKYYLPLFILSLIVAARVFICCGLNFSQCQSPVTYNTSNVNSKSPSFTYGSTNLKPLTNNKNKSFLERIRSSATDVIQKHLPSPESELLLGMTIGIDELGRDPRFKDALKTTGTVHVVVVSGFNISLVFGLIMSLLGSRYRLKNMLLAELGTLFYAVLSGFQPPVIRAWIMGSIVAWGKYYGRLIDGLRVLLFSALVMILINPAFLFNLSFQLSFLATLGLTMFSTDISKLLEKYKIGPLIIREDLCSTLSAQVFVLPLISYKFGTISLISVLVNCLILWTVPISTVLGGLLLGFGSFFPFAAKILAIITFPFLSFFTEVVMLFSKVPGASISVQIPLNILLLYYVSALVFLLILSAKSKFRSRG